MHCTGRHQCQGQYQQYINRYGPGMVVYWFGFIDDLAGRDEDLLVVDDLPGKAVLTQLPTITLPVQSFSDSNVQS